MIYESKMHSKVNSKRHLDKWTCQKNFLQILCFFIVRLRLKKRKNLATYILIFSVYLRKIGEINFLIAGIPISGWSYPQNDNFNICYEEQNILFG